MSRIKIGRATPQDMANMLAMLNTSTSPAIFADSDIVIEAITENEAAKKEAPIRSSPKVMRDDAILASNTSTISITRLAESAPHPDRFVGMHFFNPVDRMELVEVIRGEKTSDETVATVVALAKRIRKTPIVVKDCAGFLVNRVLFPYMNESLVLLEEGVPMEAIDRAAVKFGMPMGPITLTDLVGLATAVYAGKVVTAAYPDRRRRARRSSWRCSRPAAARSRRCGSSYTKGKGGKPEPNPAVTAIIAKHQQGHDGDGRGGDHRPALLADAARRRPASSRRGSSASRATWTWA